MKIKNIIESQRKLGGLTSQIAYPILISLFVTIILQKWVGIPNLYQPRQGYWKEATLSLHLAILNNKTPEGKTWSDLGANGTNHRFVTVLVVDTLSKLSKKTIFSVYKWVDNFFIFVNLILLNFFLCQLSGKPIAMIGMLLFSLFQIPTFFNHYFHPWDRLSQFFWILSLWMLSKQRLGLLFLFFSMGFLIKYDAIMMSAVSFLFLLFSQERRKAFLVSGGLFFVGLFIWLTMFYFLPNGYPEFSAGWERQYNLIQANLKQFFDEGFTYAPFVVFFIPVFVFLSSWNSLAPFARASGLIGIAALPGYFMFSRFIEVRAEIPLLLMILPGALQGIKDWLGLASSDDTA